MRFELKGPYGAACAKDAATDLAQLLHRINRDDETALCAEFSRSHGDGERCVHPDSPYGHLSAALDGMLRLLGVPEVDLHLAREDLIVERVVVDAVLTAYARRS